MRAGPSLVGRCLYSDICLCHHRGVGVAGKALIAVLAVIAVLLELGVPHVLPPMRSADAASIALQPATSGLTQPNAIVNAGDSRLFIVQQGGLIRVYSAGQLLPAPFLDVSALISTGDERGLLGLAFHPNFASSGFFYVYYTNLDGDIVIARYSASANSNIANANSASIVLTIPHPTNVNHNGGQLLFGPDGRLYIGVGDGGGGGDPANNAQNLGVLLGKILRIDVDVPGQPYGIPADNPFLGVAGAQPEIWAYGLRNPWRFSFDRLTHEFFIGDVGQGAWEEVDYQAAGRGGGANYGWRAMEGAHCYDGSTSCNVLGGYQLPVLEYNHADGACAITGGYRYRGSAAGLAGYYIYGDFCSGSIWGATQSGATWTSTLLVDTTFFISSFGEDASGEIYVLDYSAGAMYRLSAVDTDADGVIDAVDNCVNTPNPGQQNVDANFVDLPSPKYSFDDKTWVNSDTLGDACDADADNDGLTNALEGALGPGGGSHSLCPVASAPTNPLRYDSDGDRYTDGAECALGSDPMNVASVPAIPSAINDSDHDLLSNGFENAIGTDPLVADTDGDHINDGYEYLRYGSNPLSVNTDGDACGDGAEIASVNADGVVNVSDLLIVASAFGSSSSGRYVLDFDINKDGAINSVDLAMIASLFNQC